MITGNRRPCDTLFDKIRAVCSNGVVPDQKYGAADSGTTDIAVGG